MASAEYLRFQSEVKAGGGRITVAPSGTPSAAYPSEIWGAKANARKWPLPNEYSGNGKTGYYHVPPAIAAEIATFKTATKAEASGAATQLMNQWGIPDALRSLGNFGGMLRDVAIMAGIVGVIYFVSTRRR
jgi:hypothetical protein